MKAPEEIFPEYYIIRVNEFNQVAKTPLEEWLDYLKSGHIKEDTTTPGLAEAKEKLQYMQMTSAERAAYDRHIENVMIQNDILETKVIEGIEQGHEEGFGKGRAEGRAEVALKLKANGLPLDVISEVTGLSKEEINVL